VNWKAYKKHAHEAMSATFEIILPDIAEGRAASIAKACFDELDRIESEISSWQSGSEINLINQAPAGEAVQVSLSTLACLALAKDLHTATSGVFDVTVGPLLNIWRTKAGQARTPDAEEIARARALCGFDQLTLDQQQHTATKRASGVRIDLGGIGKGFGADELARFLIEDYDIETFLINAGTSTVLVKGPPCVLGAGGDTTLTNQALSGSGFGAKGAHIIDPRTGRPITPSAKHAWAIAPTAAAADALSTAFIILQSKEIAQVCAAQQQVGAKLELAKKRYQFFGAWPK
jgi:FAD:protein FMN transferase